MTCILGFCNGNESFLSKKVKEVTSNEEKFACVSSITTEDRVYKTTQWEKGKIRKIATVESGIGLNEHEEADLVPEILPTNFCFKACSKS